MPSVFTHSLLGVAAGKILGLSNPPLRFWVLCVVCPSLPDVDVIGIPFGTTSDHILGHRGVTHSIFFALLTGFFVVMVFYRGSPLFFLRKINLSLKTTVLLTIFFAFITASHGIMDGLTNDGAGIAFFWPLENTRHVFPFRPLETSPIGLAFFGERGLEAAKSEIALVWVPVLSLVLLRVFFRKRRPGNTSSRDPEL